MARTQTAGQPQLTWCGHRDGYLVVAQLCYGGGRADKLVTCATCSREYLLSDLLQLRRAGDSGGPGGPARPLGPHPDPPAHEGAGTTGRGRDMTVPTSVDRPAGEPAGPQDKPRDPEDMGEGHISGNLTADPELRFTPSGRAIANLRLAYTPRVKDPEKGTWGDGETEFFTINVWGQQGEHAAEHLQRGDRVVAVGRWQRRFWNDREGQERENTELTASDIGPSLLFRGAIVKRSDRNRGSGTSDNT